MPLSPGARLDRYEVVRFLGEGGMAHVWELRHAVLGTRHALKVLRSGVPSHRLLREGRVQARLDHPNVVPVTDALQLDGTPALVMPLVDGPRLDELLAAGPLSAADALAMFRGLVAGVSHIHAHGLVHRDLKPSNVLLDLTSGVAVPRVTDFGLVKADDAYRTALHVRLGSPGYAAPEQLRDAGAADHKADAWSLGVLLVELLTGRRPEGAPALDDHALQALAADLLQPDPAHRPAAAEVLRRVDDLAPRAPSVGLSARARAIREPTVGAGDTIPTEGAEDDRATGARYRRDAELGRGGGGVVWRVWDSLLDRPAALKELTLGPGDGPEARARFLSEAQALARLDHPNVVKLYEFGEQDGRLFLTMEHVEGGSLQDRLDRDGPLPVAEAVAVGLAVGRALAHVHQVGLLHRDVKPANVLLGPGGRVVLADFGLAKTEEVRADARLTRAGQLLGTPAYLAPERLLGAEATASSDVYALGVLLYEALAGHAPYEGRDVVDLLERIRAERMVPLQVAAMGVPRPLGAIVERGMAWDPADRFPSADALVQALEDFARGAPRLASLGVSARARTAWRRHRNLGLAVAVALGSVLAALVGQSAWSSWAARVALAAREGQAATRLASTLQDVDHARAEGRLDAAEALLDAFAAVEAHAGTKALGESWLARAEVRRATRAERRADAQVVKGVQPRELEALASAFGATADPDVQRRALLGLAQAFDEGERPDQLGLALEELLRGSDRLEAEPEVARLRVVEALARWDLRQAATVATASRLPMAPVVSALSAVSRTPHRDGALHEVDGAFWLVDAGVGSAAIGDVVAWEVRGPALHAGRALALGQPVTSPAFDLGRARPVSGALYALGPDVVRALPAAGLLTNVPPARPVVDGGVVPAAREGEWARVGPWPAVTRWDSYAYDGLVADVLGGPEPDLVLALGAWDAYGVYVFGLDDGVRLKTRVRAGVVSDVVAFGDRRLLVLKTDDPPSRRQMPGGSPFGVTAGLLVLEGEGDALAIQRSIEAPHLGSWIGQRAVHLADVDGDGEPEAVVARSGHPFGITVVGLGEDPGSVWLPEARLVGIGSLDDDAADELVISLDDAIWTLGAGGDDPPARPPPVRAERRPPALQDPQLAAVWGRAEALAAMGLAGSAAEQLAAALAVATDPVERSRAQVRASELFAVAGRLEEAADVARPALAAAPPVADAARLALREALIGQRDFAAAAALAPEDADLARLAAPMNTEVLDLTRPLDPAWTVHEPMAFALDPVGRGMRVRATSHTALLASLPLVRDGDWVGVELEGLVERLEWGARLLVRLTPVDDAGAASLTLEHRTHGGGGVYGHRSRCAARSDDREPWLYLPDVRATAKGSGALALRGALAPDADRVALTCSGSHDGVATSRVAGSGAGTLAERYRLELRTNAVDDAPMMIDAFLSSLVLHGLRIDRDAAPGPYDAAARALAVGQPLSALELLAKAEGPGADVLRWQAQAAAGDPARGLSALAEGQHVPPEIRTALRHQPALLRVPLRQLWGDRWYPRFWDIWGTAARMHPADPAVVEPILEGLAGIERADLGGLEPAERSRVVDALVYRGRALVGTGRRDDARSALALAEAHLEAWPDLPGRDALAVELALALIVADVAEGEVDRAEARLLAAVDRVGRALTLVDLATATDSLAPLRASGALGRAEARALARERGAP